MASAVTETVQPHGGLAIFVADDDVAYFRGPQNLPPATIRQELQAFRATLVARIAAIDQILQPGRVIRSQRDLVREPGPP